MEAKKFDEFKTIMKLVLGISPVSPSSDARDFWRRNNEFAGNVTELFNKQGTGFEFKIVTLRKENFRSERGLKKAKKELQKLKNIVKRRRLRPAEWARGMNSIIRESSVEPKRFVTPQDFVPER